MQLFGSLIGIVELSICVQYSSYIKKADLDSRLAASTAVRIVLLWAGQEARLFRQTVQIHVPIHSCPLRCWLSLLPLQHRCIVLHPAAADSLSPADIIGPADVTVDEARLCALQPRFADVSVRQRCVIRVAEQHHLTPCCCLGLFLCRYSTKPQSDPT